VSDSGRSESKRLSNAPDKQVTNGMVGSVINIAEFSILTQEGWACSHIENLYFHWETACVRLLLSGRTPEYCDKQLFFFYNAPASSMVEHW
jgi:hypothetical protein